MKFLLAIALLAFATTASGQSSVAVDINKAKLSWDWVQGDPLLFGAPDEFQVKCGQVSKTYTKVTIVPLTQPRSVNIRDVIQGSGQWFCVTTAVNKFGESGVSNEVSFFAGAAPSSPNNTRVTVQ